MMWKTPQNQWFCDVWRSLRDSNVRPLVLEHKHGVFATLSVKQRCLVLPHSTLFQVVLLTNS